MAQIRLLTPTAQQSQLPLFLLFPGMDGTGELLHHQVEGLKGRFDVRCLSLPGDDLSDWDALVLQVIELIEQARGDELRPIYMCGESFGGCLALKVAAYRPSLFKQLILVNPASSFARIPLFYWGSPLSNLLPMPLYQFSAVGLLFLLVEFGRVTPADRQRLLNAMQGLTSRTAAWRLQLLRMFDFSSVEFATIEVPTLLIAGGCDRLLPSSQEVARLARLLPQAETYQLPQSGHACLLEQAVNLEEILRQRGL